MSKIPKTICAILMICTICASVLMFTTFDGAVADAAVLKKGSSGADVKEVQRKLKSYGYYDGNIDGIFGSGTHSAVRRFQKDWGLAVDGIVGKNTAKALGISLGSSGGGNTGYSSSDVYLLAKCVHAEARGEPYTGQVAVAAVVLNRVKSPDFPNTISGVIYQPWAFTAVHDGQINLEPNDSAKRAARDAMNGWDPTNGCIYYYNPSTATSSWIWSRQVKLKIGKHSFAV